MDESDEPVAGSPGRTDSSRSAEGTSASRATRSRWLVVRLYLSMLAIAGIDCCFALIYRIPLERFLPTALILVIVTLAGTHVISRPIRVFLRAPESVPFPAHSIACLSGTCTAFVAAMMSLLAAVKFLLLPVLLDFDIGTLLTRNERMWLPVLHTLYYTALVYFIVSDYEAVLRTRMFEWHGNLIPAARGRFVTRLLTAFGVTSLLPISLIVLHAMESDLHTDRYVLLEDVAATVLALGVTLLFVTRSLLRPIEVLEAAMERVQHDDLSVTVPVLSNDETGRLANGFNRMMRGLRERALIRDTFGRYVPERVAAAILSGAGRLEPRSALATVMYADLEDFTKIAEHISPERVVELLNEYFSAVVAVIEANNGVVTQFQGDAMLVTFNLPVADERHADSALRAAVSIQRLCAERSFAGVHLRSRIGVATGRVTAGSVGSDRRVSYTVHGDTVNLAARLEQLNKGFESYLLLDGDTVDRLSEPPPMHYVGEVTIRGREQHVRVYRPENA